jgi:predicted GH43/DUF377 family glycosyl hydrolase
MKYLLPLLVFIFIITGCEKTSSPTSNTEHSSSGALYFSFDKANAPASVKTLTTTLSRAGYSTLEKTINITTDTLATILFEQIAIGTWKIKVDAKNENGIVLFTGQSEVIVLENSVSQVNLLLTPVSTGVGSVQINVTWGNSNIGSWIDFANNPILKRGGTDIDWGGIGQPKIFVDNGIYRMYYLNYSFPSPVSYAESQDGVNWARPDSLPIIRAGVSGKWDDGGTGPGPVYKVGEKYYMMYQGYDAINKHFKIGLAISTNGRTWEKYPNPIISDSLNWEYNLVACDVKIINEKYYLYYASGGSIGLAVSTDGINWKKYSSLPILTPTQAWESGNITFPSVVKDGSKYVMLYMNNTSSYSGIAFGIATSIDGINWMKDSQNPIFKKNQTSNNWASGGIVYPYLLKTGDEFRIYYTGITSGGEWKIGMAYKK